MAYVYPRTMRSTRDLLRRRNHLMRKRSELLAHIHNTNSQYNLPIIGKNLRYKGNRALVNDRVSDTSAREAWIWISNSLISMMISYRVSNGILKRMQRYMIITVTCCYNPFPASESSSVSSSSMRSMISIGFPECRTLLPMPVL